MPQTVNYLEVETLNRKQPKLYNIGNQTMNAFDFADYVTLELLVTLALLPLWLFPEASNNAKREVKVAKI